MKAVDDYWHYVLVVQTEDYNDNYRHHMYAKCCTIIGGIKIIR